MIEKGDTMNYSKKVYSKAILSFVLSFVLFCCNISTPNQVEAQIETKTSIYDEIKKTNISEEKLEKIAEEALVDGEKAAEEINRYKNKVDYEAAVNEALKAYYENEEFRELADFENEIDDRGSDIVEGYREAAKEREAGNSNGYEPGTVLVSFNEGTSKKEIKAVVEAEYGTCENIFKCFNGKYMVTVSISLGQTVDMAKKAFSEYSITGVTAANDYLEICDSASDYLNDEQAAQQYYLDNINVKNAWDYVTKKDHDKVLVGVIDTGIQMDHPDLQGMISPDSADVSDENAGTRLLSECQSTYNTAHGTQVAGVIAAKANNEINIAGVASCYSNDIVEILAVQASVYDEQEKKYNFPVASIIRGLDYCVEKGVKVINFSGGAKGTNSYLEETIKEVTSYGIIFVCSAGNDSTDAEYYPADFEDAIAVMSSDRNNKISFFSNYGMQKDICAPGSGIVTTTIESTTANVQGTSFSSPVVASVAAMMCSINDGLNYFDVRRILQRTSVDIELGNKCPSGLVNAYEAVKTADGYDYTKPIDNPDDLNIHNVAKYKDVTVSSTYDSVYSPASNIVDNDEYSKWVSENIQGQSVTIDLEKSYVINNIEILYDNRSITSGYQILVSDDGSNWTEIVSQDVETLFSSDVDAALTQARYIKINYPTNTSYVIIREIKVWAYKIPGDEEVVAEPVERPSEATDLYVSCITSGLMLVNWTENKNKTIKGYKYNIYINGFLTQENVDCGVKIISCSPGYKTVKVTALLNGYESGGVQKSVYIKSSN